MPTTLHWRSSFSASCLHAARAIAEGRPLADARLEEALRPAVVQLERAIRAGGLNDDVAWGHFVPLSATIDGNRQVAEVTVAKMLGKPPRGAEIVASLWDALNELQTAMRIALPKLDEELPLRIGPLRSQWEARGPGLLHCVKLFTEDGVVPDEATVVVVHPALGGGGDAHLTNNLVTIEGVLANPQPELPETVRLAWLIAQLNSDLPKYGEHVHRDRLPHVAGFALLPPTLAAAEEVELVRNSPELLGRAIDAWSAAVPPDVDVATVLDDWWSVYRDGRPAWGVALTALDQMLG